MEELREDLNILTNVEREDAACRFGADAAEDGRAELNTLDFLGQVGSALDATIEALESANALC